MTATSSTRTFAGDVTVTFTIWPGLTMVPPAGEVICSGFGGCAAQGRAIARAAVTIVANLVISMPQLSVHTSPSAAP
jgi:hypothetical protein